MITYLESTAGVTPQHLEGFFVDWGWSNPPPPERHLEILQKSTHVVLARDDGSGCVVGYVNALSDGVLAAYIPLLEVLKPYRGRGIGSELVRRILARLGDLYMVDVLCDAELEPFYARFGMQRAFGMAIRRYDRQSGV